MRSTIKVSLALALTLFLTLLTPTSAALAAGGKRPGYITGTATTECGKPLASFEVGAYGFDGQPNVYVAGLPPVGQAVGHHGLYALRTVDSIHHTKPVDALVRGVEAQAPIHYQGHLYQISLYPTDGKPDGVGPQDFSGHSGKGIIRNFVLRTSGLKPGQGRLKNDKVELDGADNAAGAFYGGSISLSLSLGTMNTSGASLDVSLRPTGTLVDGCPARPVTYPIKLGPNAGNSSIDVHDIPLAFYTLSVALIGTQSRPLTLQVYGRPANGTNIPLQFLPSHDFPGGDEPLVVMAS